MRAPKRWLGLARTWSAPTRQLPGAEPTRAPAVTDVRSGSKPLAPAHGIDGRVAADTRMSAAPPATAAFPLTIATGWYADLLAVFVGG